MRSSSLMIVAVVIFLGLLIIWCQDGKSEEWTPSVSIPEDAGNLSLSTAVSAVGPDGTVYVAFTDSECNYHISRSFQGSPFTRPVKVNSVWNETGVDGLDIGIGPDGTIHVVFTQSRKNLNNNLEVPLWYARSSDRGETFSDARAIIDHGEQVVTKDPDILIDGVSGSIWVAASTSESIEVVRSLDGGESWSDPVVVSRETGTAHQYPDINRSDDGTLHLVYRKQIRAIRRVFYSQSVDGGETFSEPLELSPEENIEPYRECPFVFTDDLGQVHVTFTDAKYGPGVIMMTSFDSGHSFQAPRIVASGQQISWLYVCEMDSIGRFHIMYWDTRGLKVVRYVAIYPNETKYRGPMNTTFDDPNNKGYVLDLSVGGDGTIHAFRSIFMGSKVEPVVQYSRIMNVPPTCLITNVVAGEIVREQFKLLFEADPGDDMTAIEQIQLRLGDDADWIHVSDDVVGSHVWDTTIEDDGDIYVSCRAWDGFIWGGNRIRLEVLNNDPPRFTSISPDSGQEFQDTLTVSGGAFDEWGFFDDWYLEHSWDGSEWSVVPGAVMTDDHTIEFDVVLDTSDLERGDRTIHLRVSDGVLISDPIRIQITLNWLPDLDVTDEDIRLDPPGAKQGDICVIEVTVRNQGRGSSGPTMVSLSTSAGPISIPLAVPSLDPGEDAIVAFPWKAQKGEVYFIVVIDDLDEVEEENEQNNVASREYRIPANKEDGNATPSYSLFLVLSAIFFSYAIRLYHERRNHYRSDNEDIIN